MVYTCAHGNCSNDTRRKDAPHMQGVTFHSFPQNHVDPERCAKWVKVCNRADLTVEKVSRYTKICSKHFVGGKGPTQKYPDPVSATHHVATEVSPEARTNQRKILSH